MLFPFRFAPLALRLPPSYPRAFEGVGFGMAWRVKESEVTAKVFASLHMRRVHGMGAGRPRRVQVSTHFGFAVVPISFQSLGSRFYNYIGFYSRLQAQASACEDRPTT